VAGAGKPDARARDVIESVGGLIIGGVRTAVQPVTAMQCNNASVAAAEHARIELDPAMRD
jgi:hypothetical protein